MKPYTPFGHVERELGRALDTLFGPAVQTTINTWHPQTDIAETEVAYLLTMDLPGLSKENVTINLTEDVLTISGERVIETKKEGTAYHSNERYSGKFLRKFRLPKPIQVEAIKASFEGGVLHIELPKSEAIKPINIEIK